MPDDVLQLTSTIVSAFLGNNQTSANDLTALIGAVHKALLEAVDPAPEPAPPQMPAVTARRSVTPDAILCMDCGKPFKSLRRHLSAEHDLSPELYRAKWDLLKTYPMVAASYSATRSAMAKSIGLGSQRKAASTEVMTAEVATPARSGPEAAEALSTREAKIRSDASAEASAKPAKTKRSAIPKAKVAK